MYEKLKRMPTELNVVHETISEIKFYKKYGTQINLAEQSLKKYEETNDI